MKVETIIAMNENVFSEMLTEFINQHKVDHVDTHVQAIHNSLNFIAVVYYYEDTNKPKFKDLDDVQLNDISINVLNLPTRAWNYYTRKHISTVKELLVSLCEDPNFERSRTIGPDTKHKIIECLTDFGIDWEEYYKNYHIFK